MQFELLRRLHQINTVLDFKVALHGVGTKRPRLIAARNRQGFNGLMK